MDFSSFKKHEILFFIAGTAMLVAVPWFDRIGITMWWVAKSCYAAGVVLFVISVFKHVRN